MKKYARCSFFTVLILLALKGFIFGSQMDSGVQKTPFPEPGGTYSIGTAEYYWIDDSRDETLTADPDDKRRLMVQVWYPTDRVFDGKGSPYILSPDEFGNDPRMNKLRTIRTHGMPDAPLSGKQKTYPVLIFSHGMNMSRFSNTAQVEHLVSHGYIVFGTDHTFYNRSRKYPDGYVIDGYRRTPYEKIKDDPRKTAENMYEAYDRLETDVWLKDAEFVLGKIRSLNRRSGQKFCNRLDLHRIGMFGYSFGGITALEMCSRYPEIKAGVSYDGGKMGDGWKNGLSQSFLFVEPEKAVRSRAEVEGAGGNYEVYRERLKIMDSREKTYFEKARNINYVLTFSGITHEHFNDMGLFFPPPERFMDIGLCHRIINDYTLAFFDRYLKNKKSDLLVAFRGKYRGVTFQKK